MIEQVRQKKNLDTNIIFRANEETKAKAEAVKSLMQLSSTSQVFRQLLEEKANQLGVA